MRTFRQAATVSDALPDFDRFIAGVAARLEAGGWLQAARGDVQLGRGSEQNEDQRDRGHS